VSNAGSTSMCSHFAVESIWAPAQQGVKRMHRRACAGRLAEKHPCHRAGTETGVGHMVSEAAVVVAIHGQRDPNKLHAVKNGARSHPIPVMNQIPGPAVIRLARRGGPGRAARTVSVAPLPHLHSHSPFVVPCLDRRNTFAAVTGSSGSIKHHAPDQASASLRMCVAPDGSAARPAEPLALSTIDNLIP